MNKTRYKVIFNKHRGQMMAVAENTVSNGKSPADRSAGEHSVFKQFLASIPVLTSAILLGLGICVVLDHAIAADIHVDPSAPKNQRPNIVQSANGTVQVNIQTPSKKGVSLNQYRQFDVHQKGAILNNSRKNTRTHLGGWVQGNPWLAGGEAKIIVNQINSRNPSQLNGYIEVAGRRAEVIMANPSGINVNGGGFINAAGVTLTTGQPIINNGQLNGYQVREGNISINGQGLDSSGSDYTRLLSKAAQINAGIWANDLSIIAGSNDLSSDGQISQIQSDPNGRERIAIDTAQLGGMYAGKISLISSEKGVGVNNAGQIFAGAGGVVISADGKLSNSGSIVAADRAQNGGDQAGAALQGQSIINSGTVSSQGKMQLQSEQLKNSGLITSADELNIRNQHNLDNQGEINASRIDIATHELNNTRGKIVQVGLQGLSLDGDSLENINAGLIGYTPLESDQESASGNNNQENTTKPPTTATGGGGTVAAAESSGHKIPASFSSGQINARGKIINDNGQITANGGIDLTSTHGLNNYATLNLNKLNVTGGLLDNQHGTLTANQMQVSTNSVDNRLGTLITGETLDIRSQHLDNRQGKIQSAKEIEIQSNQLDNSNDGLITAQNNLTILSDQINNSSKGQIIVGSHAQINSKAIDNQHGSIDAEDISIHTNTLDNRQGAIRSNKQLNANINTHFNNQGGQISSVNDLTIHDDNRHSLTIDNSDAGSILAGKNATIQAKSLYNPGKLAAGENLEINLINNFQIDADIQAGHNLTLNTQGDITNLHKLESGENITIQANNIDNRNTGIIQSNNRTHINAKTDIINRGLINSNGLAWLEASNTLNNIGTGRIYGDHIAISADSLINQEENINQQISAASIAARSRLDIGAKNIVNREHALLSSEGSLWVGGSLDSKQQASGFANSLDNASAQIRSGGDMTLRTNKLTNRNLHFSSSVKEVPGSRKKVIAYQPDGHNEILDSSHVTGWGHATTIYLDGVEYEDYTQYEYTHYETQTYVDESDPAQIISGGLLTIDGQTLTNDKSQILANGIKISQNQVNNIDAEGEHRVIEKGISKHHSVGWNSKGTGHVSDWSDPVPYNPADQVTPIKLNIVKYDDHYTGASAPGAATSATISTIKINTGDQNQAQEISTISPNTNLPNQSLFSINKDNNNRPIIETDPAFINGSKWLGSDYMLNAFGQSPDNMQKRLGDGYYEQRLISEQIARLTGKVRLENYSNNEEQFKALMDAGISVGKTMNLTPGIALSAEQVARLTTDIVWLVSQTITLPDGSQTTALVPQIYVVTRPGDLDASGTLISANVIQMKLQGDLNNNATIAGRKLIDLGAQNINNLGGQIYSDIVNLEAKNDINNIGGQIIAGNMLLLQADNNINSNSTTRKTENHIDQSHFIAENTDRFAGLYVTTKDGQLSAKAGKDINLTASNVSSNGVIYLQAGQDINLSTVTNSRMDHGFESEQNQIKNASTTEIGTFIQATGDIITQSQRNTHIRAADIDSLFGTVSIKAGKNINIEEGRATTDNLLAYHEEHSGLMSKSTKDVRISSNSDTSIASNITGAHVHLQAENDIDIQGSNIISDNQTHLKAGKDITINAAKDHYLSSSQIVKKKSGFMSSGGIGFTIGNMRDATTTTDVSTSHSGSTVGSLKGNTTIIAGNHYHQTGSTVMSPQGNINIVAKQIDIAAAQDQYINDYLHTYKQSGLTVAVNVPVINAVQTATTAYNRVGKSKNKRVNAMAAFNAGMDAYKAANAIQDLNNPQTAKNVSVSVTVGQQKSREESHSETTMASASQIYAGGQVNLLATGAGKDSNINIVGSDVSGNLGTYLQADNEINLLAAEQSHSERSKNKSSGWNAGVAISYGSDGFAFGVTAGGNYGRGHGNGDETSHRNTHIGSSSGHTSIISGGATNIRGAQVTGKGVSIDAAELNVESLQDTAKYDSKQENISGQVTVGYGASGSASYSKSKIKADYAGVTEQSGIIAGDDGYQINVKGNTDLKGAIITSTQAAEASGKNRLTTGSLTYSDIENHSDYKGSSFGFGGGVTISGSALGQDQPSQNDTIHLANQGDTGVNKSMGFGRDSGHSNSTTHSGINTSNISITDADAQQQRSGKSTAATIAAIHTDINSDNYANKAGYLANNFDKDKVQAELDLQREVSQEFDQNRQDLKKELLKRARKKYEEAEEERKKHNGLRTEKSIELEKEGRKMEQNIAYLDTALGILWAGDFGTAVLETVALHADYAKNAAKHITAGKVYKVSCSGSAEQYFCKDINNAQDAIAASDGSKLTKEENKNAPFDGTAIEIYDYGEIMDGKAIFVSNPGIYNNEEAAFRNAVKQNPEAAKNGNLYVVINNPTVEVVPGLGEVGGYAFYDKINEWLGGRLPLSNAQKTNAILKQLAKETGTEIMGNNHSRGSMTDKISMAYLINRKNVTNVPIAATKVLGPAANQIGAFAQLQDNGWVDKDGISSTLFLSNLNTDFVGRLVGMNLKTAGECIGNPFGSCYSHSSYNGHYYLEEYLKDENGNKYIDRNTGKPITNPEFDKIEKSVGGNINRDENGRLINPTLAQAYVIDANGNINLIDRFGTVRTYNKWTHRLINTTHIPIHEVNGKRYFNFEGKRYHADPPR